MHTHPSQQHLPLLGEAYEGFLPLMLRELAELSKQGISVAPHDGLDLVHGFFLDEWPRTYATYCEAQGDLWRYVRTAFRRYVRHEVRREGLHRLTMLPAITPRELRHDVDDAPASYDLARVDEAVQALDPVHREALWSYLATASERATGRRLGLPRSRVRSLLEEAVALVAASVEPPATVDAGDWFALTSLWQSHHASRRTPAPDAEQKASRAAQSLLRALRRALPPASPHAPTPIRTNEPMNTTAADLLRAYLGNTAPSPSERQALRENAHAVLDALSAEDAAAVSALQEGRGGSEANYELLYRDLATAFEEKVGAPPLSPTPPDDLEEEREIGQLFLALIEAHPLNGQSLEMTFSNLGEVDPEVQERVYYSTPAVAAAGLKGAFLARVGLTPLDFFQAADVVGDLAERLEEETGKPVCLSKDGLLRDTEEPETLFVNEIAYVTGVKTEVATHMLRWLLRASEGAPRVFTGVVVEECLPDNIHLRLDPDVAERPLEERWTPEGEFE